jgi:peptide/nickel transport system substrate-binding protein
MQSGRKQMKRGTRPPLWPVVLLVLIGALVGAVRAGADPPANVLAIDLDTDIDYVDPALAYYTFSWQIEQATCAKLLNYPDKEGAVGRRLVPEIATGMPSVSPDGRTYTFHLRDDFHFSPPSNEQVRPVHFKWALERAMRPQTASPAQPFFDDIVGARDVINGLRTDIPGIVATEDTLTITIEERAGDFLSRLAMPFACPLPLSVGIHPDGMQAPVPSAGPYYIDGWTPKQSIHLTENPNYHGNRPHYLDEIAYTIGFPLATIRLRVESGESDHGPVPPVAHGELALLYGPASPAAAAGKQRWFAHPSATFRYLALNHDRPLFGGNVNLKKAVNYAIDRQAMLEQRGSWAGQVTDQYLPPSVPGFTDAVIYPSRPDVVTARALSGWQPGDPMRTAILYTCNTGPCVPTAEIVKANLAQIGLDVQIQAFPRAIQFTKAGTRGEPFDLTLEGWHGDYLDPYDFLFLLDGTTIRAANNTNFSYFNDPAYNTRLHAANALTGEARLDELGDLDADVARDSAPLAAYTNDYDRGFFSDRIGCHVYQPGTGQFSLNALCLRPEIPATDAVVGEQAGSASFTVTLSNAESSPLTVQYATVDGTASAGQDYTATGGTLTFLPGERTKTVTVPILEDGVDEADETFTLRLANATKGTPTGGGNATILDNDAPSPPPPTPPSPPTPPATPPAPPAPPTRTLASVGLVSGTVAVSSSGVAPIRIRCGGAACRGSLALFAPAATRGLTARKPVKLGQARFSIPRGKTQTVRVRLSARGLKALKRAKRLKAQVVVTLNQSNGRTSVKRSTVVLRAPRGR